MLDPSENATRQEVRAGATATPANGEVPSIFRHVVLRLTMTFLYIATARLAPSAPPQTRGSSYAPRSREAPLAVLRASWMELGSQV